MEVLGREPSNDELGFWHDRDVVAYYGDPKWEVRLQAVDAEIGYSVESAMRGDKYVVTVKTFDNFSLERMKGDKFKQEHVLDLPFSYIFPKRLANPTLAEGQAWMLWSMRTSCWSTMPSLSPTQHMILYLM